MYGLPSPSRFFVKFLSGITLLSAVFVMVAITSGSRPLNHDPHQEIVKYYNSKLDEVQRQLTGIRVLTQKRAGGPALKNNFYSLRIAYKKLAPLSEYFDTYESTYINGPAIQTAEDDNPDRIIEPHGLQILEQLIFEPKKAVPYPQLNREIVFLDSVFRELKSRDRTNDFRTELVWDAVRASLLRLMTIGITGTDSPIAKYSLKEGGATLDACTELIGILTKNLPKPPGNLLTQLNRASTLLKSSPGFDQFNRLDFITRYLDPAYAMLVTNRKENGIPTPEGNAAIDYNASSLFAKNVFNLNAFGPSRDYWLTEKRIALGKKLFFDPMLSANNSRSCASCHQPAKAFTDQLKTPLDLENKIALPRNTPTVLNAGLQTRQFFDSRVDILENQLDEVVHNTSEMGGSLKNLALRVKELPDYAPLFREAYKDEPDPFTPFIIGNAISSYVRSLVSMDSRFDKYMRGDHSKLTEKEKQGFNLFAGKGKCATCHFIPVFNGLQPPMFNKTESEVLGVPSSPKKTGALLDKDEGKYNFTHSPVDRFSFKTPTLRNVELTAPYMHNGVFNTLEEVLEFYNNGGGKGLHIAPANQTLPFDRLNLTKNETEAIIAFMKTLTDTVSVR